MDRMWLPLFFCVILFIFIVFFCFVFLNFEVKMFSTLTAFCLYNEPQIFSVPEFSFFYSRLF